MARTAEIHELKNLGMGADEYMSKPFNPVLQPTKYAKQHRATSDAARDQAKKKYFE